MKHVDYYNESAVYHLDVIRKYYKKYFRCLSYPKTGPLKVMDIGCGSGRVLFEVLLPLLPKNLTALTAIDLDGPMVEFCRTCHTDPKITFEQLDMSTSQIPKKHFESYDLLFSSLCFSYVKNFKQGLINSNSLLKPNGELLFIFQYKYNQLYGTYRKMSQMSIWKPYLQEYANFTPHFSSGDPESQMILAFKNAGLKIINHEIDEDHMFESSGKNILGVYLGMETEVNKIVKEEREQYRKDFIRILAEETKIDFTNPKTLLEQNKFNVPTMVVHAKK